MRFGVGIFGGLTFLLSCETPFRDFGGGGIPFITDAILGSTILVSSFLGIFYTY